MPVPMLDLRAQYRALKPELDAAVADVLESQQCIGGPHVEAFESEMAAYLGVPHTVGLASGTAALLLSLRAMGVGSGGNDEDGRDEVITSPFTFFATAGTIVNAGAEPVFVDIDPDTYAIDPGQVEKAISFRTKAIVPVHLFGHCAGMAPIIDVARRHNLRVLEDTAQALGAQYDGQMAGTLGDAGAFSFFPSKTLGAAGDAGLVATADAELAERLRLHRNHGAASTYHHELIGTNSRLDALQAAILRVKLRYLASWVAARRDRAAYYTERLRDLDEITPPSERANCRHAYNYYVIRLPQRDRAAERLRDRGIGCAVYYPLPLHEQPCFAHLDYRPEDCPNAHRAAQEVLALPIYPELTPEQQDEVVDALKAHLAHV